MLEIKNISKEYKVDNYTQKALDNVSVNFRDNEFASILGPSGSGKTTLLNIIGGLDKYDSGDLIINGVSTKNYNDRDWDTYRNHKIGFIFQSYNLIGHQTILSNVELALTLAGISKAERRKRAIDALDKVGLKDHINKRPNQLSGGQMQRVAIARALINNPDILLADEPTGALDSVTSVQIMELLKEVAKDKLVIMVTHNPELAKKYSTRIIELKDGKIISDNNSCKEKSKISKKLDNVKKTSMSFITALSLSFNNLMIKKKRTLLVSFASSIGIIGIALILGLSTGFQNYIDKLQEDTLASYPLTITTEHGDLTNMLLTMVSDDSGSEGDKVIEKQYISSMFGNVKSNDLKTLKGYIDKNYDLIKNDVSTIKYSYNVEPLIYTKDVTNKITKINPSEFFSSFGASSMYSFSSVFNQMIDDISSLEKDYNVLAGSWPKNYNEMVIVLSSKNTISDLLVYSLGLRDSSELNNMIKDIMAGKEVNIKNDPMEFTYEDLMNVKLKLVNPSDMYKYNSKYKVYEDLSEDSDYVKKIYDNAEELKIVGVVAPNSSNSSMSLMAGVAYPSSLTKHIIDLASESEIVKKQLENENIDVFTNKAFDGKKINANINFEDMISIDKDMLQSAFGINLDENKLKNMTSGYTKKIEESISTDNSSALNDFNKVLNDIMNGFINDYDSNPRESVTKDDIVYKVISLNKVSGYVNEYINNDSVTNNLSELEKNYYVPANVFKDTYKGLLLAFLNSYIGSYSANDSSFNDGTEVRVLFNKDLINSSLEIFLKSSVVSLTGSKMADGMLEAKMKVNILTTVGELSNNLVKNVASSFNVDQDKIAKAFKFNLSEQELSRLMNAFSSNEMGSASTNLSSLGYQDIENPSMISLYFNSFDSKENVLKFIDNYNEQVKNNNEEDKVINYTDTTGILMKSVKKIVDSVSYVLIAFVSISLIVSSIMIGIITYISVLERTKEIGILRAIGASKKNISSIFNAETFIIGLLSGIIGIGISLFLLVFINQLIHKLTGNPDITAVLPLISSIILICLSVVLTLIGGLIPSRIASKKDPVEALRTE